MVKRDLPNPEEGKKPGSTDGQLVWVPPGYEIAMETPEENQTQSQHLWEHIWLLWRWRWLIILCFVACAGAALLMALRSTPIYEGTAKIRIEPDVPKILSFEDMASVQARGNVDYVETQRQIIGNRAIAAKVIERMKWPHEPEGESDKPGVFDKGKEWATSLLSFMRPKDPQTTAGMSKQDAEKMAQNAVINSFLKNLTVSSVRNTEIVQVSFLDPDPELAAQVANAVCEEYIQWNYQTKFASYDYARTWLGDKLDEMQAKLEQSEENLHELAGGQNILPSSDEANEMQKDLEEKSQIVSEAERKLFEKEFELAQFEEDADLAALLPAEDTRIQKLLQDYAEAQVRYEQAKAQYGPEMTEMKTLTAAIKVLEDQLEKEKKAAHAKAKTEHERAKSSLEFLRKSYESQRKKILDLQQKLIQYNILKREVDTNRDLYDNILQRWKEVGVASGIKPSNATIIETASRPNSAKFPNKTRTVLLGAFLGMMLGVGLTFFINYMDTSVKDADEIERLTRTKPLGQIPTLQTQGANGSSNGVGLIIHEHPKSALAENIRAIRTALQYSMAGHSPKVILVTSALPGEGKTTTSSNLSISFAQNNNRVLLIDADLKRPAVHKLYDVNRREGLTEVLTGEIPIEKAIQESGIPNLWVLPSGSRPPNPVDLLDSKEMRELLHELSQRYDRIILDTAPVLDMADTLVLVPRVDGLVLVVRLGKTPRAAVRQVCDQINAVHGRNLGVVMNHPQRKSIGRYGYGYSYSYGYGGHYGEDDSEHGAGGNGNGASGSKRSSRAEAFDETHL